jgi:hypothetical protein
LIKLLGLSVVAALAIGALVGASSASAWGFCKEKGEVPCTVPYKAGTIFTGTLEAETKAVFTESSAATCKGATVEFELLSESGSPVTRMLTATFANCNSTVSAIHLPWEFRFLDVSEGKGLWEGTATALESGAPGFQVGSCSYTTTEMHYSLEDSLITGGAPKLRAKVPLTGTCGNETFAATYRLSPSPIYPG